MVWIHGGGFVWGSNNSRIYGPEFLITEDAVIVAINYRLGILGKINLIVEIVKNTATIYFQDSYH